MQLFSDFDEFHVDVRALTLFNENPLFPHDHLLAGNDGGVSLSEDAGISWLDINGVGLAATQFYHIANSEIDVDQE